MKYIVDVIETQVIKRTFFVEADSLLKAKDVASEAVTEGHEMEEIQTLLDNSEWYIETIKEVVR